MKTVSPAEAIALIKQHVDKAGGQVPFSNEIGTSQSYVSDVINAKRPPSDTLLASVGLEKRIIYVRSNKKRDKD
jgi:hypothetical protein